MRFPRLRLRARQGLKAEAYAFARYAAEFVADMLLFSMPCVGRTTLRKCKRPPCPRYRVATRARRRKGAAARDTLHDRLLEEMDKWQDPMRNWMWGERSWRKARKLFYIFKETQ